MNLTRSLLIVGVAVGMAAGIGSYTFAYAKGASYLSNDPAACANCHIMEEHYTAWSRSSHRDVATCNDCHSPPEGLIAKYANKASNGFWHSLGFTTGGFADPLQIREVNVAVTEAACRSCHVVAEPIATSAHSTVAGSTRPSDIQCLQCHASVGHWVR
jgi:cytochrome c nitrite reductase small subunit